MSDEFDHDAEVMLRGILLSESVRRFLARNRTQQIVDMGFILDEDVVRDLQQDSEAMLNARRARLGLE